MAAGTRTVLIKFLGDAKGLGQASSQGEKQLGKWQAGFKKFNRTAVKASLAVGVAAVAFGKKLVDAGQDGIAAERVLANVFKKMGGAGSKAFKQAVPQAAELSKEIGVTATEINRTQVKLATFGKIWSDPVKGAQNFGRATKLSFDLAAAGFGSADTNAAQLGKALQDPIKGINALARSGVTFEESEKKKIKALVESGQILKAQEVIYAALEKQVGGSAAANVTGAQKSKAAWENLQDSLGRLLVPVYNKLQAVIQAVVGWVERNKTAAVAIGAVLVGLAGFVLAANAAYKVYTAATRTASAAQWLFTRATGASSAASKANTVATATNTAAARTGTVARNVNTVATARGRIATLAAAAASKAAAGAQLLLNAAMRASPLARVIALVVAIGAALVTAWNRSATFRRIAKGAFQAVAGAVGWVIDKVSTLIGWIKDAIKWIGDLASKATGTLGSEAERLKGLIQGARAAGGPVAGGRTYLVGERGPELFTPSSSGHVTSNEDLRGGGIVVQNLEVKAFSDRFDFRQVMRDLALNGAA